MQQPIMMVMALGAVLGGMDRLLGNRFGLGQRFEEGFRLLGPIALSMAGILCLEPLLSLGLSMTAAGLLRACGLDASILAGILAIDMGGFPMAQALATDPAVGRYVGVVVTAIFGCTVSFTIPIGMGMLAANYLMCCGLGIAFSGSISKIPFSTGFFIFASILSR